MEIWHWKVEMLHKKNDFQKSGQITIIPKPELRGFWGDSLTKPPFHRKMLIFTCLHPAHLKTSNLGKGNRCSGCNSQAFLVSQGKLIQQKKCFFRIKDLFFLTWHPWTKDNIIYIYINLNFRVCESKICFTYVAWPPQMKLCRHLMWYPNLTLLRSGDQLSWFSCLKPVALGLPTYKLQNMVRISPWN